jgi:hypothetical protein
MKVLFVVSGLGMGGAEEQVVLLSKALVGMGHQAGIYCLSRRTERLQELAGSAVEVSVDDKRGPIDAGVLRRLRRHVRRSRPDIVHSFGRDSDVYARLAALGAGVPVVNSERSDHQQASRFQRFAYRLTCALCDGVVANTRAGAAFAQRLHGLAEEQVDVLWNSVELQAIDARVARSSLRPRFFPAPGSSACAWWYPSSR